MVVRLVAELRLVFGREGLRVAEPAILERGRWQPGAHAVSVVGVLAERLAKVLARHADGERIHLRRRRKALGLAHEVEDLSFVSGHEHDVSILAFDLRQQRVEVGRVGAVALVHDHVHAGLLQQRPRAVGDRDVEGVVRVEQRHRVGHRLQRLQHVYRAGVVVAGWCQRAEDVLEVAREDLVGGAAALHHRHLVLLGNRRVGKREVASKRAQQQVDLVLRDELRVLAHAQVDVGLVVVDLEHQLLGLARDLHAAGDIDLVDGQLVGIAVVATRIGNRSGELHRRAEDDVLGRRRAGQRQGRERRDGRQGDGSLGQLITSG